ncbi:hypothetical protein AJ79_07258 [Helicocarpus griseus UAMH5409]|uniref:Uncharacterized protein n=1 Tax=Helicocarpus griseus UAMH5409 TaxID=1447875 RepID=A0A2B7X4X3_9EURO|nr:hypothetical protein AJ79_07258 [Helicocarpus griseus UAMH5409]
MERSRLLLSATICFLFINSFVDGFATTIYATSTITTIPPSVIGYHSFQTSGHPSTTPLPCPEGQHFTTSSAYGYCCSPQSSGNCAFATECKDGTIKGSGFESECGRDTDCVTISVYEYFHMIPPFVKYMNCLQGWTAFTLHRHLPPRTTTSLASATSLPSSERTSTPSTASPTPASTPKPTTTYNIPTSLELHKENTKTREQKQEEVAKISGIIVGTVLFLAIIILALLLGRSKWNKPPRQRSLRIMHEAEGSFRPPPTPARRRPSRHSLHRAYSSREGFRSFEELSHSGTFSPAQELPTVVEERYHSTSVASSPISPCVSSPR